MENYIELVKNPTPSTVQGFEALSIGESFSMFFAELNSTIDKRLALLSKSVHPVDVSPAEKNIRNKNLLYVKNAGVQLLIPEGYRVGMGNMAAHSHAVIGGVYIITSLKTEASRLYHWLKQILKTGRVDQSFKWTVTDFDRALESSVNFIKGLPQSDRAQAYPLSQVYVSFEEFYEVVAGFNNSVRMIGGRDAEIIAKELSGVYELGNLLTTKIKSNDILLGESMIRDIEAVCNRFVDLTNLCGAMMVLLNEMTAVLSDQVKTLSKL